jgi:hypothetical protein
MTYLTVEDVRRFMFDRTPDDNGLEEDLSFEDADIKDAMCRAAREFNALPPFVMEVHPDNLPTDTNIFLYATVEQLSITKAMELGRNDADYSAGGTSVNVTKSRIKHYKELAREMRGMWLEQAAYIKYNRNIMNGYNLGM